MDDLLTRVFENLTGRVGGPLTFRLVLQPAVAILLAVRDGLDDARHHRAAYFWAILVDPLYRREAVSTGWAAIAKVFIVAFVLDGVYQVIALRWFYPGEALIVAVLLAILPYLLLRGAVNRVFRAARQASGGAVR